MQNQPGAWNHCKMVRAHYLHLFTHYLLVMYAVFIYYSTEIRKDRKSESVQASKEAEFACKASLGMEMVQNGNSSQQPAFTELKLEIDK